MGSSRFPRSTAQLDFNLESLEQRRLLAADWSVSGASLKITGDAASDVVVVQQSTGNVTVQVNGGAIEDTGIGTLERLTINMGDGNDDVTVDVETTKLLKINLGSGDDRLTLSNDHASVSVIGGRGSDAVVLDGVLTSRGRVSMGADADTISFDMAGYSLFDFSALASVKNSFSLGAGDDAFLLTFNGAVVGEDNISELGFSGVTTIDGLINTLAGFGLGEALGGFAISGGGGTDVMQGDGAFSLIVGLSAKVRSIEIGTA